MVDTIKDNFEIGQIVLKSKKTGAVYIGGGVPKNYINDATVMFDYTKGHSCAFQITADAPHWEGALREHLDEAKSWGKVSSSASRATAYGETTVMLPIVVGAILQRSVHEGQAEAGVRMGGGTLSQPSGGAACCSPSPSRSAHRKRRPSDHHWEPPGSTFFSLYQKN